MKISEMNKILKEMKSICNFKDNETEIKVRSAEVDPCISDEMVKIETQINGITVVLYKFTNKGE